MEEVNGKVWIQNIDGKITDVFQLDPNVFKITYDLIKKGADMEIGPAMHQENSESLKGLYCSNLKLNQIIELLNQPSEKSQNKPEENK